MNFVNWGSKIRNEICLQQRSVLAQRRSALHFGADCPPPSSVAFKDNEYYRTPLLRGSKKGSDGWRVVYRKRVIQKPTIARGKEMKRRMVWGLKKTSNTETCSPVVVSCYRPPFDGSASVAPSSRGNRYERDVETEPN